MNGEQTTDMKDIRTETYDTVPDPFKPLASPHFDEFAVAAAQQVQPLSRRRNKRFFRSSLLLIAYLEFIVATVGVAYLSPPNSRADASNETISSETQSDAQPALDGIAPGMPGGESMATSAIRHTRRHSRRVSRFRFQNQNIEIVRGDEGKPVPRKVSELSYGRSSDRP